MVTTDLESQRIEEVRENSVNFVGGPGKVACTVRLGNYCCNIVSGREFDDLFWISWLYFYLFY